jgi:S-DNA-T family DNA segregation ATPase FtsK/SpoIIIE
MAGTLTCLSDNFGGFLDRRVWPCRIKTSMPAAARRSQAVSPRRSAASASSGGQGGTRLREVFGIVLLALGLFTGTALLSLQFGDGQLMGPLGRFCARAFYATAGIGGYLMVAGLIIGPIRLLSGRRPIGGFAEAAGGVLGVVSLAVLLHLVGGSYRVAGYAAGGRLGEFVAEVMRAGVSTAGTALFGVVGIFLALIATTPLEIKTVGGLVRELLARSFGVLRFALGEVARFVGEVVRAILPEHDDADYDDEDTADSEDAPAEKPVRAKKAKKPTDPTLDPAAADLDGAPLGELHGDTVRVGEPFMDPVIVEPRPKKGRKKDAALLVDDAAADAHPGTLPGLGDGQAPAAGEIAAPGAAAAATAVAAAEAAARLEPVIVESIFQKDSKKDMKEKEKHAAENRPDFIPLGDGVYRLPSVSLLKYDDTVAQLDKNAMLEMSARLTQTLSDYGIKGEVQAIRPGPVVTMYEFAPAPGTRVSKIASLDNDIAMRLEAPSVRIVAPIPGKAVIGVEVPNKTRETVWLKEIITDDVFTKAKSKLAMALGKDIEGRPVAFDLGKMPHLLVAGTTGSGKSVCVNTMIASILYNATPEEVRMIMVDPKMLELSIYEGIPHLLLPVVTDPKKANLALRWAVEEMERRYELLAEAGVRDLGTYNRKIEKQLETAASAPAEVIEVAVHDETGAENGQVAGEITDEVSNAEVRQLELRAAAAKPPARKLPFIVVIIDEFADLMMVAPKDIETSVARIAQKARAAGIHLVLATQRPSVDVITGLIKANFPSRIAFKVVQRNDSRTVLDQNGAEALLGQGDMLFSDRGGALRRVHGCLVQDEEIHQIVAHLKKQAKPVYDMDILKPRDEDGDGGGNDGPPEEDLSDDMYDKAVALVSETRQASISMIQRRLRVGYNRAARMVERMEKEGVVGPPDGTNRREVLISPV